MINICRKVRTEAKETVQLQLTCGQGCWAVLCGVGFVGTVPGLQLTNSWRVSNSFRAQPQVTLSGTEAT